MKAIAPDCLCFSSTIAFTLTSPLAIAARRSGRKTCGIAKLHEDRIDLVDGGQHAVTVLSATRTVVPALFGIEPMRPDTGARISV